MTLTLNLSPEQEQELQQKAIREAKSPETIVVELVDSWLKAPTVPAQDTWSANAIAEWEREGVIGEFGDPYLDSQALAQHLKERATQRWSGLENLASETPTPSAR